MNKTTGSYSISTRTLARWLGVHVGLIKDLAESLDDFAATYVRATDAEDHDDWELTPLAADRIRDAVLEILTIIEDVYEQKDGGI